MKILITAFGPFDGRVENASSLALHALTAAVPGICTRILPVDSVVAPARLKQALRRIRPDVIILLGEAAGAKTIRLESTAWNELDFKIPDIAGRQPAARAIDPGSPPIHRATLPLAKIQVSLEANGHQVSLSHDPGRYLCNQVFFTALDWLHTHALPCRAGFIHLPLASDYPTDRAADALAQVVTELRIQNRSAAPPA
ncbi:MAG: pyrrolidone-carboxylate peptidase [Verrucomicrobiota bacterium]|jgi:pyroglutamyl-peptidase